MEIRMKKIGAVFFWVLLVLPLWALAAQRTVVEVDVEGMACSACSYRLEKELGKLDGVNGVHVSLKDKRARIVLAPGEKPDVDKIKKTITEAGFTPGNATVRTEEIR
jgi:copper chaperone CopZ